MESKEMLLYNAEQVVTCAGNYPKRGKEMSNLGVIKNGAVIVRDGIIAEVGETATLEASFPDDGFKVNLKGKTLMPGFVDSHTHFLFAGYRANEFDRRLKGESYMSIMNDGGGIVNTVEATRKATADELYELGMMRLNEMLKMGVTTVECKSGYGLDEETELKMLDVIKRLNESHPVDVVSTFLGAHAVPRNFAGHTDEYVSLIINDILPRIGDRAEFCDVFCEKGVFDKEQTRLISEAARKLGYKIKLHADEIVSFGGAELAVDLKAYSADHLLKASAEGICRLAHSNTIATLLPLTAFSLNEEFAQGRKMIDAGCAVALASDYNPGSCFSSSIPLLIALACLKMKLTVEEAIMALTLNGAAALDKAHEVGSIENGKIADMIVVDYPSYEFLPYHVGMNCVSKIIKKGKIIEPYLYTIS